MTLVLDAPLPRSLLLSASVHLGLMALLVIAAGGNNSSPITTLEFQLAEGPPQPVRLARRAKAAPPNSVPSDPAAATETQPRSNQDRVQDAGHDDKAREGGGGAVLSGYEADVLRTLNARKRYPESARRLRLQGRVRVQFQLNREGEVLKAQVVEPSPHASLNEAARKLIDEIHHFRPFPDEVKETSWVFTVPLEYTM